MPANSPLEMPGGVSPHAPRLPLSPGPGRGHKKERDRSVNRQHAAMFSTYTPAANSPRPLWAQWQEPGSRGFFSWVRDVRPRILTRGNSWEPFEPTKKQREQIEKILELDQDGRFKHSLALLIEPRRHGKSTIYALIILWLATSRRNFLVQLLGTTEQHSRRTQFNTLKGIIKNTPRLRKLIPPDEAFETYQIVLPLLGNAVQMSTGINLATSFGQKLNLLWASDLHANEDLGPFNAFMAALLDSEDSLCFIDSNVDITDGDVHNLQREAEVDEGIYADYVCYKDFADFEKRAPAWIDRGKAKRLERTSLPSDFKRDILGLRSDARNALFPQEIINGCQDSYELPVNISDLVKGRAYKIAGGLDRAKSLFGHDHTIWSVILKAARDEREHDIYLLNQVWVTPNTGRLIKKVILKDHQRFNLDNVCLESFEIADLKPWIDDQKIPCEVISPTGTAQHASFTEFFNIAKEGRFHYPKELKELTSEMQTFTYTQRKGGTYSFGASTRKQTDDRVYSINWAIFALRETVLNLYSVGNIHCQSKMPKRHLCFLLGGEALLLCRARCPAYKEVDELFKLYRQAKLDDELTIDEFFHERVRVEGARVYQAV